MFTLIVEGIPVIKLRRKSEFPSPNGDEAWLVVDENRNTIASYSPAHASGHHAQSGTLNPPIPEIMARH